MFDQLIEGKSNEEIARALNLEVKTIKSHITPILKRFDCDTRSRLIARHYRGEL